MRMSFGALKKYLILLLSFRRKYNRPWMESRQDGSLISEISRPELSAPVVSETGEPTEIVKEY